MEKSSRPTVPSFRFATAPLSRRDRFEAWRATVAPLHETSPAGGMEPESVSIETTVWNLGGLVVSYGHYSAQSRVRSNALVRRSGFAGYRLTLPVGGCAIGLETGDDRRPFHPGESFITDLARPDRQETSGMSEAVGLFLPQEAVDTLLPKPSRLHGLAVQGPLATLLRDHLIGVGRLLRASAMPAEAAAAVAQATLHLFAAAVAGAPPAEGETRAAIDGALRRRVAAYIEENLLDPELGPEMLCQAFHMSRATLYRLFRPLGGVSSYVRERRLVHIHAELRDPTRRHHLGQLAEIHGFTNQTQMGRAYKARYGHSPSETKSAILTPTASGPPEQEEYGRWLHAMVMRSRLD